MSSAVLYTDKTSFFSNAINLFLPIYKMDYAMIVMLSRIIMVFTCFKQSEIKTLLFDVTVVMGMWKLNYADYYVPIMESGYWLDKCYN